MVINKSKLAKGVTCSMDKSDDLFNSEDNTIEDQMNLDKTKIRKFLMKILKSMLNNWK